MIQKLHFRVMCAHPTPHPTTMDLKRERVEQEDGSDVPPPTNKRVATGSPPADTEAVAAIVSPGRCDSEPGATAALAADHDSPDAASEPTGFPTSGSGALGVTGHSTAVDLRPLHLMDHSISSPQPLEKERAATKAQGEAWWALGQGPAVGRVARTTAYHHTSLCQ